jgi:hypothetical protein
MTTLGEMLSHATVAESGDTATAPFQGVHGYHTVTTITDYANS